MLQKHLSGKTVRSVQKLPNERILELTLAGVNEVLGSRTLRLVVQLSGRSANVFLLDEGRRILESLRDTFGNGQRPGDTFSPPTRQTDSGPRTETEPKLSTSSSPSSVLDEFYQEKEIEKRFRSKTDAALKNLDANISKRRKLTEKLKGDLKRHGDADKWKRFGDLLLANISTAVRDGDAFVVTDLFDEGQPTITIQAEDNLSITEAAEKYFRRYTKARNAVVEIAKRMEAVGREIAGLEKERERLRTAIEQSDEDALSEFIGQADKTAPAKKRRKTEPLFTGARTFRSSDGMEILVGKRAKDNDHLSCRVAKSLDLWLHAADYPGSHVVIRNPTRGEIPHQTLLEAAQLAAFYSDARDQPKAAVNYTQKKFVNKPKGAAPGLVRLAFFKTILVVPKVPDGVVNL
jgi:predicted ribosome quality control (RQC) complex YloA/Tae2 family protein